MARQKFCHACGSELHIEAEICPKCGVRQRFARTIPEGSSEKKILPAFLFAFFLGVLGVHRFYVGKTGTGIAMLIISITVFGLIVTAIWALIDWIMIVSGNFRDKDNRLLTEWS